MAALGATAVAWRVTPRWAALAAMPVLSERAALAATLLADRAALAVTAALAGRLMAAARLVAMADRESGGEGGGGGAEARGRGTEGNEASVGMAYRREEGSVV